MINFLKQKPDGFFDNFQGKHLWLSISNDKGVYGYVAIGTDGQGAAALHVNLLKWNKSILKSVLEDWEQIKRFLKIQGFSRVIAANADTKDARWPKFINYLGFQAPELVGISIQEI